MTRELEAERVAGGPMAGHVLSIIGGALLAIGPFLPWAQAGMFSANGMQKTGDEAVFLAILGVTGFIVALVSSLQKKNVAGPVPAVCGLIGGAMSVYYYVQIKDQLDGVGHVGLASIGFGIYACVIGAVLLMIGGLMAVIGGRRRLHTELS